MLRSTLLASMTDCEKSVKNLVNDTNLRLAGLLQPHQRIGEEGVQREVTTPKEIQREATTPEEGRYGEPIFEEPEYMDQMVDDPLDVPIFVGNFVRGVNIREPSEIPARAMVAEADI